MMVSDAPEKKWRLWKAALIGLPIQILATAVSDHGRQTFGYLISGYPEPTLVAVSELSATSLIFVIIAFVRNRFIKPPG